MIAGQSIFDRVAGPTFVGGNAIALPRLDYSRYSQLLIRCNYISSEDFLCDELERFLPFLFHLFHMPHDVRSLASHWRVAQVEEHSPTIVYPVNI